MVLVFEMMTKNQRKKLIFVCLLVVNFLNHVHLLEKSDYYEAPNFFLFQDQQEIQETEDEYSQIPEEQEHENFGLKKKLFSNSTIKLQYQITVPECGITQFFGFDRIVGGRPASQRQFPWQVYLNINTDQGGMLCGGSILNPWWILTAAHCISNEQTGEYTANTIDVVAGTLYRDGFGDSNRQIRTADCAFKHPSWRGVGNGFAYDIALIRLPKNNPLNLNYKNGGSVNGICLPPKTNPPFEYTGVARVSGWGLTRNYGSPSRNLQYTDVNIISDQNCRQYQYPVNIIDSMICQGLDNSSPCQGDSGGPLTIHQSNRYIQIGLVSFGPGICNNGRIPNAVFTQVSFYLQWIENTIRTYYNRQICST